jgi:hypothetical protein
MREHPTITDLGVVCLIQGEPVIYPLRQDDQIPLLTMDPDPLVM